MKIKSDTIAAQATPPGRGGVGIIRVSGSGASLVAREILDKKITAKNVNFCSFIDSDTKIIDQGIAIYFSAPNSFTGEDVLELHGHGGQIIMDLLLQRVLDLGVRLANPGEFTQRAFLNHKFDLVQAEAVADLIDASTSQAAQNAMRSLQGDFSKRVNEIAALLINLRAHIEAAIDFTEEEDIKEWNTNSLSEDMNKILSQIKDLKNVAKQGMILREGITAVITGSPNAGKSSLLNCLSGQDAAIVTNVPGTTRDVLRAWIQIEGLPIHILDTAGLHNQPDLIEEEGIRRAWEEIKKADHVLLVIDASCDKKRNPKEQSLDFLKEIPSHGRITVLYNKIDLTKEDVKIKKENNIDCIYISTKTGQGLDLLKEHLRNSSGINAIEDGFSARRRHLDALARAENYLEGIQNSLLEKKNVELMAEDLRCSQKALGEITGEVVVDDLLDKIFSEFCIGK